MQRKKVVAWLAGVTLCAAAGWVAAAEQFVPLLSYRVGAYAAGGSGIAMLGLSGSAIAMCVSTRSSLIGSSRTPGRQRRQSASVTRESG